VERQLGFRPCVPVIYSHDSLNTQFPFRVRQ
jgi:hypothetical protein